jgi:hypothetical protein
MTAKRSLLKTETFQEPVQRLVGWHSLAIKQYAVRPTRENAASLDCFPVAPTLSNLF